MMEKKKYYGDNYLLVSLYYAAISPLEFEEKTPDNGLQFVFDRLKKEGITGVFGPGTHTEEIIEFIHKNVKS